MQSKSLRAATVAPAMGLNRLAPERLAVECGVEFNQAMKSYHARLGEIQVGSVCRSKESIAKQISALTDAIESRRECSAGDF
jgi:hypothetical protein